MGRTHRDLRLPRAGAATVGKTPAGGLRPASAYEPALPYGGHEYFYQRSWSNEAYEIYVLRDSEVVYHKTGLDMNALSAEVLTLRIYDGKTVAEAQDGIKVLFEA